MENKIEQLSQIIKDSNNIVFFGGAGCSCESGIPDFRSSGGIFMDENEKWVNVRDTTESNIPDFRSSTGIFNEILNKSFTPEEVVSYTFFYKHPEEFYKFYKEKLIYKEAKPNKAHLALAKLEEIGKLQGIITQNIDGLHQMAGNKKVLELHGSIHRNHCTRCKEFYDLNEFLDLEDPIPLCKTCASLVKPDVVLYEEGLDENIINEAINLISTCDTLIVGGTSLVVYPAASFLRYFRGKNLILINKSETQYDDKANLVIHDSIGKVLDECINSLL